MRSTGMRLRFLIYSLIEMNDKPYFDYVAPEAKAEQQILRQATKHFRIAWICGAVAGLGLSCATLLKARTVHIPPIVVFPFVGPIAACFMGSLCGLIVMGINACRHPKHYRSIIKVTVSGTLPFLTFGIVLMLSINGKSIAELFSPSFSGVLWTSVFAGLSVWVLLRLKTLKLRGAFLALALAVYGLTRTSFIGHEKSTTLGPVTFSVVTSDGQPVSDAVILVSARASHLGTQYYSHYFVTDHTGTASMPQVPIRASTDKDASNEFVVHFKGIDYQQRRPAEFIQHQYYAFPDDSYSAVDRPERRLSLDREGVPARMDFHLTFDAAECQRRRALASDPSKDELTQLLQKAAHPPSREDAYWNSYGRIFEEHGLGHQWRLMVQGKCDQAEKELSNPKAYEKMERALGVNWREKTITESLKLCRDRQTH